MTKGPDVELAHLAARSDGVFAHRGAVDPDLTQRQIDP